MTYRIRDWQASERPRERLAQQGPQALTDAELLAILLRVGVKGENAVALGRRLLQVFGGLVGLHLAPFAELQAQRGVGMAKAAQLKAALELGRRLAVALESQGVRPRIETPEDAAALLIYEMSALEQEVLRVLLLDTRHHLIGQADVVRGSVNSAQVRVAEVFRAAVRQNAAAVLLAHNHPSGDPTPSPEDVALTQQVIQAGRLLDIEVLDHLVVGRGRFVSLRRHGLAFSERI